MKTTKALLALLAVLFATVSVQPFALAKDYPLNGKTICTLGDLVTLSHDGAKLCFRAAKNTSGDDAQKLEGTAIGLDSYYHYLRELKWMSLGGALENLVLRYHNEYGPEQVDENLCTIGGYLDQAADVLTKENADLTQVNALRVRVAAYRSSLGPIEKP